MNRLPKEIESLQDQGFALKDIAILVRTNAEAVEVAETLLAYADAHPNSGYRYDIISNEALQIGNARSVKAMLALLRYFQNREDRTGRFLAVYEFIVFIGNTLPMRHCGQLSAMADRFSSRDERTHRAVEFASFV